MLAKLFSELDRGSAPRITRICQGKDTTARGAYPYGTHLTLRVEVPRALGASAVVLRLSRDGGEERDLPLEFRSADEGVDTYAVEFCTEELCASDGDLFFYELLFLRGFETLFTDSVDNVEFLLSPHSANRFRLFIYSADFETPAWFREGTMYHIFLDRFCEGKGNVTLRKGAKKDPDWENGIPMFAKKAGDPLANNIFFGGNLWGVIEKLDYLASLGVTVLYLSPIFEAASNHRYDTADYERVDEFLGGDEAFAALVKEAHARGMKIVLDGVFNHTGDDSRYFNAYGNYPTLGAFQSQESPYRNWFNFRESDGYESWWGIKILPRLNHANDDCRRYFTSQSGIAARWLRLGADGWRLDVADELSDGFLDEFRETVKETSNGDAVIIGEVWENAVEKTAYGTRRRYFCGGQLDSVMNYPFRSALLALLQRGDTEFFVHTLTELYSVYPRPAADALMNLIGTHDTERILTLLGDEGEGEGLSNDELSKKRLTSAQRARALRLLKIASTLQFTVYGIPSIYYGDEVGMEGYHDPFCRFPYPWGRENAELLCHYRMLGALRRKHPALRGGSFRFTQHEHGYFVFERERDGDTVTVAVNLGVTPRILPVSGTQIDCLSERVVKNELLLPAGACAVLVRR